jgi:hypothetical protein
VACYSPYDYTTMLSFKMTNVKDRKYQHINNSQHIYWLVGWFMVFNATIIDISVISWWSWSCSHKENSKPHNNLFRLSYSINHVWGIYNDKINKVLANLSGRSLQSSLVTCSTNLSGRNLQSRLVTCSANLSARSMQSRLVTCSTNHIISF